MLSVRPLARGIVLGDAQPAELRVDLLGGLFADVTGVEDHQIRVIDPRRLDEALAGQRVHHALRIVDVHLTAIGLDMQLARARRRRIVGTAAGLQGRAGRHRRIIELRHHPRHLRGLKPRMLILRPYDARATS